MAEPNKLWIIDCLKYSLQALAMPADVQPQLYPDFVVVADELALDFDNFYSAAIGNFSETFSPETLVKLNEIDALLSGMSKDHSCWSEKALQQDQRWSQIRSMASSLLDLQNWPIARPPFCFSGPFVKGG